MIEYRVSIMSQLSSQAGKVALEEFFLSYSSGHFRKKEVIIKPQDKIESIYYIKKGSVKMSAYSLEGDEITLHIFQQGSYFPVMLCLTGVDNTYYFEAIEEVEVIGAPAHDVMLLLQNNSDVLYDLTVRFSGAIVGLIGRIEKDAFQQANTKVTSLLVYLAEKFGETRDGGIFITLPLSHQDIASWLGLQRETVSRQLEKLFAESLVIKEDKHFVIPDIEKLRLLV